MSYIWGVDIPIDILGPAERSYLNSLPASVPSVAWLWNEMDRIWDAGGLDNALPLSEQNVRDFYQHPVWLVNGIFTAVDPISKAQREAIAHYIATLNAQCIADYGGGFGEMAIRLHKLLPEASITIIEPYPSPVGIARLSAYPNIHFAGALQNDGFDVVIVQDVLEHVEDPVRLAYEISQAVKIGGRVIFANCFYPVIKCHVPSTFYLRYTFKFVMRRMGLDFIRSIDGAEYAQVFQRNSELDYAAAIQAGKVSRVAGYFLNRVRGVMWRLRRKLDDLFAIWRPESQG
jgi:2-polyprenyl-3-methyl-5-hydroxy-6-metoxy-1,4-benzoquinol methylase